jgi:uncharacterized NAD(P)/FAD-binding protein YdhS
LSRTESNRSAVAIVGGGCSGLLVALHLLRGGFRDRLTVIEPREQIGLGLAYSTPFQEHLLNVRAGKMSAFPDQPAHFLDWLRARHWRDATEDSFAPRRWFGQYLNEVLRATLRADADICFNHVRAEALDASLDGSGACLTLGNGETVLADRVVLALGNPASCPTPGMLRQGLEDHWHLSPWFGDALQVRFAGERILLMGTGLTAVDALLAVKSQPNYGEVFMLSSRGILPQVHNPKVSPGDPPPLRNRGNVRLLFRELREHIQATRQKDLCWRTVIDALRPLSNQLWAELPLQDRKRFLRHLKRYWEPHRHRMAPEVRSRLEEYRADGGMQVIAGKLLEAQLRGHQVQVRVRMRHGVEKTLDVDRIISCTGVQENYTDSSRPLIHALVAKGLAQANDLGIGFRTDGHGALMDASRHPSSVFFTLGPPRRGELFESTAVPEIRDQAEALASHLLSASKLNAPRISSQYA